MSDSDEKASRLATMAMQWGLGRVEITYFPDTDTWAADLKNGQLTGMTYEMLYGQLKARAKMYDLAGIPAILRGGKRT